jgi:FtsZ-binding cell division protein ZapB
MTSDMDALKQEVKRLKEKLAKKNVVLKVRLKQIENLTISRDKLQSNRNMWRDKYNSICPLLPKKYYKITYSYFDIKSSCVKTEKGLFCARSPKEFLAEINFSLDILDPEIDDILEVAS